MLMLMMHGGRRGGRGGIAEGGRTRPAIECAATLKGARVESLEMAEDDGTLCCLPCILRALFAPRAKCDEVESAHEPAARVFMRVF